jgi:uncharacterized protein YkwD
VPISSPSPAAAARHSAGATRILLSALVATSLAISAAAASVAPALAYGGDGLRAAANEYRTEHGRRAVFGTALLDDIATRRAGQMVAADELEHDFDYVIHRLNQAGVCWRGVGEIIAWDPWTDYNYDAVVGMWWDSPVHHDIMMGAGYNAAGGAWKRSDGGGNFSVMVFVELCGASTTLESQVELLRPDERYSPDRALVLAAGRHTAYRFDADGHVLKRKTVSYDSRATKTAAGRVRVNGDVFLKVSSGALRGFWVRESARAFVRGVSAFRVFAEPPAVDLDAGRYIGKRFTSSGGLRDRIVRRYWHSREELASAMATVNGVRYLKLASGKLAGWWVRDTRAIDLR